MVTAKLQKLWREGGDLLERWTNGHLDRQPPESLLGAQKFLARVIRELGQTKDQPEQLRELAAQRQDRLARLQAEENSLSTLASGLELLVGLGETAPPKPGRPKGSAPGLADADADVRRIETLWKSTFKVSRRAMAHQAPTAVEIATRRHRVTPEQLENFRKNKPKQPKR